MPSRVPLIAVQRGNVAQLPAQAVDQVQPPRPGVSIEQYTRSFKLWSRLFPGSKQAAPAKVSDTVGLSFDVMRATLSHDVRMTVDSQTTAIVIGNNDLTMVEAPPGFVCLPVTISVNATTGGAANVQLQITQSASALDPWGRWELPGGTAIDITTIIITNGTGPFPELANVAFPIPRGNQLRVRLVSGAAVGNLSASMFCLMIPGELTAVELFKSIGGQSVMTRGA